MGGESCICPSHDSNCLYAFPAKVQDATSRVVLEPLSERPVLSTIAAGGSTLYGIGAHDKLLYKLVDGPTARWTLLEGATKLLGTQLEVGGFGRSCGPSGKGCSLYTTFGGKVYKFVDPGYITDSIGWKVISDACSGCTSVFAGRAPVLYVSGSDGISAFEDIEGSYPLSGQTILSGISVRASVMLGKYLHILFNNRDSTIKKAQMRTPFSSLDVNGLGATISPFAQLGAGSISTLRAGMDGSVYFLVHEGNKHGGYVGMYMETDRVIVKPKVVSEKVSTFAVTQLVTYGMHSTAKGVVLKQVTSPGTKFVCKHPSSLCPFLRERDSNQR